MADFDSVRDQTLMFFLDHLIGKGQTKTLHDLSCQFGAKGFTREMRQIAGGSQAGLKKFLSQFPSLFTINGESVRLTPLASDKDGTSVRDYTKETLEFFTEKLLSYGIAEVPLKSLFGHRSQASSEIRHVSGQSVKEFREFLQKHNDIFIVRDDYVVLKSVLDQLEQEGHNELLKRMPEEITYDPYLLQKLVNELEETVFSLTETYSDTIAIDLLHSAIKSKEHISSIWKDFIKVPSDLNTFLHMNSKIFLVQGQTVSLTVERKAILLERKNSEKFLNNQSDNIGSKSDEAIENRKTITSSQNENEPITPVPVSSSSRSLRDQALISGRSNLSTAQAINQRIRSQINKIVSQGSSTYFNSEVRSSRLLEDCGNTITENTVQYDVIDLQKIKPKVIVDNSECGSIVEKIFQNCSAISFDVQGVNLGENAEVTLIQIGYLSQTFAGKNNQQRSQRKLEICLFDVFLNPNLIRYGLKSLLESEKIVKVAHDVRKNSVSLYKTFNIKLCNVFDTQVAHLVLQQQQLGSPAYKPTKYISFFSFCQIYAELNFNPKLKDRLHKLYKKDYRYWRNRPLTDEMIQFAIIEVYALFPIAYEKISKQIRSEYQSLFKQLVYESIFAHINAKEIRQIKRQRKFELELADLKLKLFNSEKKKIVLSNREIRLLRHIDLTEEIRNKIEGPSNVAKKLKRFDNQKSTNGRVSKDSNGDNLLNQEESNEVDDSDRSSDDDDEEEVFSKKSPNYPLQSSSSLSLREMLDNSGDYSSNSIELCQNCYCILNGGKSYASSSSISNGKQSKNDPNRDLNTPTKSAKTSSSNRNDDDFDRYKSKCDITTQTISTGDIVITKFFLDEPEK
ncbi:Egalitarian-like protein [Sarcoptes scabiei]|uniref:Egalitarian-like protein n=1 Tax=Sarcoptes scabiei TaxID=52283 RepID=A0A132AJC6_SARSC|nr:Egalitarian-like protein [Sarcoptes scabiei]